MSEVIRADVLREIGSTRVKISAWGLQIARSDPANARPFLLRRLLEADDYAFHEGLPTLPGRAEHDFLSEILSLLTAYHWRWSYIWEKGPPDDPFINRLSGETIDLVLDHALASRTPGRPVNRARHNARDRDLAVILGDLLAGVMKAHRSYFDQRRVPARDFVRDWLTVILAAARIDPPRYGGHNTGRPWHRRRKWTPGAIQHAIKRALARARSHPHSLSPSVRIPCPPQGYSH